MEMEIVGAIIVFLFLMALLPERMSRSERAMKEAFPADRWTVYPSMDNDGKWGIYRNGIMYLELDTREEAEAKAATLH